MYCEAYIGLLLQSTYYSGLQYERVLILYYPERSSVYCSGVLKI